MSVSVKKFRKSAEHISDDMSGSSLVRGQAWTVPGRFNSLCFVIDTWYLEE